MRTKSPQKRFDWLKIVRTVLFLSKKTVAERMGCSPQVISAWERREQDRDITLAELQAVASAMDCELVYFFSPVAPPPVFDRSPREPVNRTLS